MTQFATRKGLHMLYPPEPLDRWIGRDIRQTQEGDYLDCSTGEVLGQQESKEYEQYQQRFLKRCKLGGKADRLLRIVDRYMPRIAAENRVFTMRFPEKVHDMLLKAQAIRRKTRARTGSLADDKAQQAKRRKGEATTPSRRRPPKKQKLDAQGEDNDLCKDEPLVAHNPPVQEGESEVTVRPENRPPPLREIRATSASETPPDWGGSETDENQAEPHHNHESSDEGEPGQPCNQWPWGPEARPSDSGTSRGVLAHRPAEPAGEPPQHLRRRDLPQKHRGENHRGNPSTFGQTINKRWRAVYQIQAHMAQFREDPRESGGRSE